MSRDAPTTQKSIPTTQNTQKTTPTKEAASTKGSGRLRRPPPFVVSFVGVGFCVFCVVGQHICVVWPSLDTIAQQSRTF